MYQINVQSRSIFYSVLVHPSKKYHLLSLVFSGNMEVLRLTRQILVIIGLCELSGNEWLIRTKCHQRISFSIILTIIIAMEVSSILYAWDHLRIGDLENSLYAAFQVAAAFCIIGSLITISYQKKKVRKILHGFQLVADYCKWVWFDLFSHAQTYKRVHLIEFCRLGYSVGRVFRAS